jgi:lipopolysaccharide/colanic/teichoic acid biosynthesis glycosyltransferase
MVQPYVVGEPLIFRENRAMRRLRRLVDIALVLALSVVAVPVLAIAAMAILIEDGRPLLFKQRRVGRFERLFAIYKLRTMKKELCGDSHSPTSSSDDRITRVGRFLRETSIDELPQLLNVLRGEMSLIGPRPEMGIILPRYETWQHLRHLIPPGITCIWQSTVRSTIPLDRPEATALDLDYIHRASPFLDGAILLRTVNSLVSRKGAY